MNTFIKLIPLLALAALVPGLSQAGGTQVGLNNDGPKMTVRFADLNLAKPHDVETLYRRIQFAARLVCTDANSSAYGGDRTRNWIRCLNATIEDAVMNVNRPVLTAFHQEWLNRRAG